MKKTLLNQTQITQIQEAQSLSQKITICAEIFGQLEKSKDKAELLKEFAGKVRVEWFAKEEDQSDSSKMKTLIDLLSGEEKTEDNEIKQKEEPEQNRINYFVPEYSRLIKGIIDYLSNKGYEENEYYNKLWDFVYNAVKDASDVEKGLSLYLITKDERTPYIQIPKGISMNNIQYSEMIDELDEQIKKIKFIMQLIVPQKTETASMILDVLDELDTKEEKAVLLSCVISMVKMEKPED